MMKHNFRALWQLITINYKEFIREPGIIFWSIVFPVLMAWVLGVAFTKRGELVQTIALVDDPRVEHQELKSFLSESRAVSDQDGVVYFHTIENKLGRLVFRMMPVSQDSAFLMVKRGQTSLILKELKDSLIFQFDPQSTDARYNYIMLSAAIHHDPVVYDTASVQVLSQLGTRYVDFLIPGLLALGIMNGFLWGIGYGLIEIRSKKLLRRMVAAPMKKWQFIISHFFARITLSAFEAAILLLFSWIYFRIEILGSLVAFFMIFAAGSFCFAGISILMAARTSSSRIGNGLINFISMPMMVLSGIFFSYHNFPEIVVPFIQKLPLTMLADSLRSIMTEGTGIGENLPEFMVLSGLGFLCFLLGIKIYKWY
jgi:ABC-type multidrug transport system permease subunit